MMEEAREPSYACEKLDYEDNGPPNKKIKVITAQNKYEKLEDKLNYIFSCSVCLALPISACMQCCNGHLMCIGCYHHLLADARLKDEQPTCPSCRVDISHGMCSRNLAAEKAVSELPLQCPLCSETFPRNGMLLHQSTECIERVVLCRFKQLGCGWSGPAHELDNHVGVCVHSSKSPSELLQCLDAINKEQKDQVSVLNNVVSLLSCNHISYIELQLRPHRTDDFVTKLFYESNRFHLLGHTWVIKAFVSAVEKHPSNPTALAERKLTYQVVLKSKTSEPLEIDCMILRAPYENVQVTPSPSYTRFSVDVTESKVQPLECSDVNRLLSSKVMNVRLFMFQHK